MVNPFCRRQMPQQALSIMSVQYSFGQPFRISEACYRYQAKFRNENILIAKQLIQLNEENTDWGFGLCFAYLRQVGSNGWNQKQVYCIYCELALNLRVSDQEKIKIKCA